jgi:hypothetical protein
MNENVYETATRRAAGAVSRRGSLRTLGGALAAVVAAPSLIQAKKGGKNDGNAANRRCKRQVAGCRKVVLELCGDEEDVCQAVLACCPTLGACNATAFFACVEAID